MQREIVFLYFLSLLKTYFLALIQLIWGKTVVVLSKKMNSKNIYNKKIDIYEKCCTFDGPDIYSEKCDLLFFFICVRFV